jgi:hypothetical protein
MLGDHEAVSGAAELPVASVSNGSNPAARHSLSAAEKQAAMLGIAQVARSLGNC